VVDSPFGRIGLAVCYDLRFPSLFRAMKNVDMIVLPAAFTETPARCTGKFWCAPAQLKIWPMWSLPHRRISRQRTRDARNSMIVDPWGAYWTGCHAAPAW